MTVAVAEQLMPQLRELDRELSLVEVVPDTIEDINVRNRAACFIGKCLVGQEVWIQEAEVDTLKPTESLYDAIHLAAKGNQTARRMVETNARTDVIERTIKTGHVIKVDLQIDAAGKIQQHGQRMESVQANSLRLASSSHQMLERTEAETINSFRIERYMNEGKLNDYYFVVFSRAADNMSKKEMDNSGFFTDTMSCAIQATTFEDGKLTTESAFVSGVKKSGEQRHDGQTLAAVGELLDVDFTDKSATETLNIPILISKKLMPYGVIHLVELYDICAGGTFFGEVRSAENYLDYLIKCKEREETFRPKVDAIVQDLIKEAPYIQSRIDAIRRLHKISEKHMVEQAAFDRSIDPKVFGSVAAVHIEQARDQFEQGNNARGLELILKAKHTAQSYSCPTSLANDKEINESLDKNEEFQNKEDGDCEFVSRECPMCGEKNVKTKVTKHKIEGDCGCVVKK